LDSPPPSPVLFDAKQKFFGNFHQQKTAGERLQDIRRGIRKQAKIRKRRQKIKENLKERQRQKTK
jgi:hypothetical protein